MAADRAHPRPPDSLRLGGLRLAVLRLADLRLVDLRAVHLRLDLRCDASGCGYRWGYAHRGCDAEDDGGALHGVLPSRPLGHEPRVGAAPLHVVRARDV